MATAEHDPGRAPGHQLIGRGNQYDELARVAADTGRGRGGLVLVGGEAGVGKTRLVTDALGQQGAFVLGVTAGPVTVSPLDPPLAISAYDRS